MNKGGDYVIVLGGMIGVGKTTYAEMIANHLDSDVFYESVDDNPLLDKFYHNKKRWAFALQIYFLNKRFKSIKEALIDRNNVLDRSIYEDALFARINYEDGNMSQAEFDCYLDLLDNMMEELEGMPKKAPDLFIYLQASFETIEERIEKRGRDFEQFDHNPELEHYMRNLHSRYDDWVFNHYDASEILVIDADRYDVTKQEDAKEVLLMIDKRLAELEKIEAIG
ncbi:deoxyadenosine/deoxycytidine kinase [Orenia metallireducens]|jgi:deoxyadenosine/deoxycytidine kinase|uniref:Deoxyadenosine/deoxycytidine kinase n=1 Tax=Orenia metallireducens TaxID=1413210 RepID=A0A285HE49_9FIRM|nr:deoxynucleoside kinase [Orenia metallireducens]PRX27759.1 deoxyadenosine/deoxycytidine kinase [Orenia metallireducens]SNY33914.1 Deoxyadenosine/deoxycytidine kinase [Orenia metallireducens]